MTLRHAELGERLRDRRPRTRPGSRGVPTPTMTPWPGMSRGTDCTVPIVPGLVSVTVVPAKSSGAELVGADLADQLLVGAQKPREVERVGVADAPARAACGCRRVFSTSTARPRSRARGGRRAACRRRPRRSVEFITGTSSAIARTTAKPMRWVKLTLPPPGAAEVVVEDLAVDLEQLGRDLAEAGGGRDLEARLHVGDDAGGRAAERLAGGLGGRCGRRRLGRGRRRGRRRGRCRGRRPAGAARAPRPAPAGAGGRLRRRRRAGSRRRTPASSRSPRTGRPGTARTSRRRATRSVRAPLAEARAGLVSGGIRRILSAPPTPLWRAGQAAIDVQGRGPSGR